MFQTKVVGKIKTCFWYSIIFSKNHVTYEMMFKYVV